MLITQREAFAAISSRYQFVKGNVMNLFVMVIAGPRRSAARAGRAGAGGGLQLDRGGTHPRAPRIQPHRLLEGSICAW